MFLDEVEIYCKAGDGGDGSASFRREKYVAKGGPDGGDGGRGGDIIVRASPHLNTLYDFRYKKEFLAGNGAAGMKKKCSGRSGETLIIMVPCGTLIYDKDNGILLKDLKEVDEEVFLLRGGRGGRGNVRFASSVNQTPMEFDYGGKGEGRHLKLELKVIADVGLIGLPNAGKSTLLTRLTKATPKVANYPFTTLNPELGIVALDDYKRFVMVDIPGLVEGAHKGKGLGHQFLKHVERTRTLVHLLEIDPIDNSNPAEHYKKIRHELKEYSTVLATKTELVVLTKTDLLSTEDIEVAQRMFEEETGISTLGISSVDGNNLEELIRQITKMLEKEPQDVS